MRTSEDLLYNKGNKDRLHDWQCKKLIPIDDLSYVILNLLKAKFVVDIYGYKYDITFGYDNESEEVCYSNSIYPSPYLSEKFMSKAFRQGVWYEVSEEDLTQQEIDDILKPIKEKEKIERDQFLKEAIDKIKSEHDGVLE